MKRKVFTGMLFIIVGNHLHFIIALSINEATGVKEGRDPGNGNSLNLVFLFILEAIW